MKSKAVLLYTFFSLFVLSGIASAVSVQSPLNLRQQFTHAASHATRISDTPPLYVNSQLQGGALSADVYALLDTRYNQFRTTMTDVGNWCDFVTINLNVKACVYQANSETPVINLYVGRKFYQPPEDAYLLRYSFKVRQNNDELLDILLVAEEGPLGTSNYRIHIQAMAYEDKTLIRFNTGYEQSMLSDMATRTYLNTLGKNKVGFTVVSYTDNGEPVYNDGMHAVIERNAMRYYLALQVYLGTLSLPEAQRFESRIQGWFDETMRYQVQLYELEREEYLQAKRQEYNNQRRLQASLN
jgi:hypothetical protein